MTNATQLLTAGNIVKSIKFGDSGMVLAVTKDGARAKIHTFNRDGDDWYPVSWFAVEVSGDRKCHKCNGSGLFYMGGAVVNGVYTGKTGPCFGCGGNGVENDADRVRNHVYYRDHYRISI